MSRWEYGQVFIPNPEPFGGLPKEGLELGRANRAGEDGWELVSSVPYTTPQGEVRGAFLLFKREVPESG
jgi:hypothetical protein